MQKKKQHNSEPIDTYVHNSQRTGNGNYIIIFCHVETIISLALSTDHCRGDHVARAGDVVATRLRHALTGHV